MEQRRNARAGETGDPRENPLTSRIVPYLDYGGDGKAEGQCDLHDAGRVVVRPLGGDTAAADEHQQEGAQELGHQHPPDVPVVRDVLQPQDRLRLCNTARTPDFHPPAYCAQHSDTYFGCFKNRHKVIPTLSAGQRQPKLISGPPRHHEQGTMKQRAPGSVYDAGREAKYTLTDNHRRPVCVLHVPFSPAAPFSHVSRKNRTISRWSEDSVLELHIAETLRTRQVCQARQQAPIKSSPAQHVLISAGSTPPHVFLLTTLTCWETPLSFLKNCDTGDNYAELTMLSSILSIKMEDFLIYFQEKMPILLRVIMVHINWSEEHIQQFRNERAGKAGEPRETPPNSGIVRHDSHTYSTLTAANDQTIGNRVCEGLRLVLPSITETNASDRERVRRAGTTGLSRPEALISGARACPRTRCVTSQGQGCSSPHCDVASPRDWYDGPCVRLSTACCPVGCRAACWRAGCQALIGEWCSNVWSASDAGFLACEPRLEFAVLRVWFYTLTAPAPTRVGSHLSITYITWENQTCVDRYNAALKRRDFGCTSELSPAMLLRCVTKVHPLWLRVSCGRPVLRPRTTWCR
ncbi:hypothetical protein PR048_005872 [Dryococelus australis]|uniref:Uncharacterized protein n=1 Tax=Dryococelus australis TaxID=614101 RepID=A0ABQ9I9H5_9NEOP|nr:hypothetical protein PR048_005872 [Dryococelus australis]